MKVLVLSDAEYCNEDRVYDILNATHNRKPITAIVASAYSPYGAGYISLDWAADNGVLTETVNRCEGVDQVIAFRGADKDLVSEAKNRGALVSEVWTKPRR